MTPRVPTEAVSTIHNQLKQIDPAYSLSITKTEQVKKMFQSFVASLIPMPSLLRTSFQSKNATKLNAVESYALLWM